MGTRNNRAKFHACPKTHTFGPTVSRVSSVPTTMKIKPLTTKFLIGNFTHAMNVKMNGPGWFRLESIVLQMTCPQKKPSTTVIAMIGLPFNLRGRGAGVCFEINNFGQTLHEINNLLEELLYVNM